jgi:hypothetical protein
VVATSSPSVNGLVRAAYDTGAVMVTAALRFVTETVRAAESLIGEAAPRRRATPADEASKVRRPLARVGRRKPETGRARRAS